MFSITVKLILFLRGSAIAKIIGNNVMKSKLFEKTINMYVYEEMVNGQKLTDIINTRHENVKYLPGVQLPTNVVRLFWNLILLVILLFSSILGYSKNFCSRYCIANRIITSTP